MVLPCMGREHFSLVHFIMAVLMGKNMQECRFKKPSLPCAHMGQLLCSY